MKIVVFLNKDIEANIAYNLLKPTLVKHEVHLYYSETVGTSANKATDLVKLEYLEKEFINTELFEFMQRNKIKSTFEFFDSNFATFPLKKCDALNSLEFIEELTALKPDLFISIRFGKIFKDAVIKIPKNGLINLHSAILPNYRGIMGTLHAIKNGDKEIGCTLHTIPNSGIDTGEIIKITKINVQQKKSLFWHIVQLYPLGADLLINSIKAIKNKKTLKSYKQNLTEGSYFSLPSTRDFKEIKSLGMEIISAEDYQEIITTYLLPNLSKQENLELTKIINVWFQNKS